MRFSGYFLSATVGLFLIQAGAPLFSDGMFLDGLNTAIISRNLAEGRGTFWQLYYSDTLPTYYEHPPLAFGILSLFFRVFGDSMFVERFYSLLTFIAAFILISLLWLNTCKKEYRHLFWLPLLYWVIMPKVPWAYANNMLENTLCIFILLATWLAIKSVRHHRYLFIALAGICLFFGLLTKGPVALFPWITFILIWMIWRTTSFKRSVIDTLILFFATLFPFLIVFTFLPEGVESLKQYVDAQLIHGMLHRQLVSSRFYIIEQMLIELLPLMGLSGVILIVSYRNKIDLNWRKIDKSFIFYTLLSLSAVIPIMITLKQRGHYLLPSLPFFSLAFGFLSAPYLLTFVDYIGSMKKRSKITKIACIMILIAGIIPTLYYFGRERRQTELISDITTISAEVPNGSTIGMCNEMYKEWYLHAYFARYANISLDRYNLPNRPFVVIDREFCYDRISDRYDPVPIVTRTVKLYRMKNSHTKSNHCFDGESAFSGNIFSDN